MKAPIIQVTGLRKDYRVGELTVQALRGVDLEIYNGDFTAIMGASGSGKSTMLNILGCLDKPTAGTYLLDGIDMAGLDRNKLAELRNQKLGFIFQSYNLLPRTTTLENTELPLLYNPKIRSRERRERAMHALEQVGLADRFHHMPNQLSGGQQQRVAIARALVNDPLVILADEATGNLDTRTSYEVLELFQKMNDDGKTIVFVTHEQDIARFMKRNIHFRDGKIQREIVITDRFSATELISSLPAEDETNF